MNRTLIISIKKQRFSALALSYYRAFLIITLCVFGAFSSFGQNIKGVVVDEANEPIAGASIYITEIKQGIIANADGVFQFNLKPGVYNFEVKSMGYEALDLRITIREEELVEKTIVLKSKDIQLAEVQVSQGEDRAYAIMREAIKKAPYYQQIVKAATFETYSKGSALFTELPALFEKTMSKEDKEDMDMYRNRVFLKESLVELEYEYPGKYERTVKAFSSTIPFGFGDDPESAIGVGMISLYYPEWGSIISPFNTKAFNYYRFRYEGYEEEDGQIINIIRIIPKLKDPKLIEGIIHIADEEWSIRFIDYTQTQPMLEMRTIMNFNHISDDVYLVTNYESKLNANVFGLKMNMALLSSVQYFDIQLNDSLLIEQQSGVIKPKKERKEKKSLELKSIERNVTVDSLATERDSLYWTQIRTIALNEEELRSYQYVDTLKQHRDSLHDAIYNPKFSPSDLLTGGTVGNDSTFMYFRYNGLIGGFLKEYNFVDGLWMGQSFELDFKKRKQTGLVISPEIYWASARKALIWKVDADIDYAPRRLGRLSLSAGGMSKDFAGNAGINRFLNSTYSAAWGRNYARFYDSDYISLHNRIDIANGLQLTVGGQYEKMNLLDNHTTWNLFGVKSKWKHNWPDYDYPNLQHDTRAGFAVGLEFTPEYYYRIHEGKKYYVRSRFPTFKVEYRHGFSPDLIDDNSHYNRLELSVYQDIRLGYFSRLNYKLVAGKFFGNDDFNYIDYKHFNISGPWLSYRSWNDSYALLPYYKYATNDEWVQAFVNYDTDYLLLKRLPFLQGKMFTETLMAKFLYTPDKPCYTEWGYGLSLFGGVMDVAVFVGFDKFKYESIGVQMAIPLIQQVAENREITLRLGF